MARHRGLVSSRGPKPTGSYPHAHIYADTVWVTAQAGRDPGHGGELAAADVADQLDQAIDNLAAILEDCGSSLDRVVKTQIMYTEPQDADAIETVLARRFGSSPVCTAWGVKFVAAEPGSVQVRVQIDCLAELS